MQEWISALRPHIGVLSGMICLASFKMHGDLGIEAIFCTIFLFFACSAIMTLNDWHDRFHDLKKNKTLASKNNQSFFALVVVLWGLALALLIFLFALSKFLGLLASLILVIGYTYSCLLRIPFAANIAVSIAISSSSLFSIIFYNSLQALPLFAIAWLYSFSREIIKDLEDADIDHGHKWSIPIEYGKPFAKNLACLVLSLSVFALPFLNPFFLYILPCIFYSISKIYKDNYFIGKLYLDLSTLTIISVLLF